MRFTDPLSAVNHYLYSQKIIPDVIPENTFFPSTLFSITYPGKGQVTLGEELAVDQTQLEPDVVLTPMAIPSATTGELVSGDAVTEAKYTVVMTDPDAPSNAEPTFRQFRHWVITGLQLPPPTTSQTADSSCLKTRPSTCPYRPPGPRPGSGLHRYTFLLFLEPTDKDLTIPEGAVEYGSELEQRRSWNAVDFGEKYGLKLVGATYFLVRSEPAAD